MKASLVLLSLAFGVVLANSRPGPKALTQAQIDRLSNWTPEDKENNWQLSGQFEGDMILTPHQRNGLIDSRYRWPGNTLVYRFSGNIDANERNLIISTLDEYTQKTCIRHREATGSDSSYIYVDNLNSGCWSYVGWLGGVQDLNLQKNGCMYKGTILHEFKHALGFYHQQSATERDDYVDILWQNIQAGTEHNFDKYDSNLITNFGTPYDYGSIMHYDAYAFSSNGQKTISTKNGAAIGQRDGLSGIDVQKVNSMYNC